MLIDSFRKCIGSFTLEFVCQIGKMFVIDVSWVIITHQDTICQIIEAVPRFSYRPWCLAQET